MAAPKFVADLISLAMTNKKAAIPSKSTFGKNSSDAGRIDLIKVLSNVKLSNESMFMGMTKIQGRFKLLRVNKTKVNVSKHFSQQWATH
eukprot:5643141-Amphidinium_carterae.1